MSGSAVVCLHGLGRTPADWNGVRGGLERFGAVRSPAIPPRPADGLECVDAVVVEGDIVVGHSMGGVLALRMARERPRRLRALILTGCFFPPARNGRGLATSIGDYAAHRVAFVRSNLRPEGGERSPGSGRALASLIRLAATPGARTTDLVEVTSSILVVHARDDHHVPVDFAIAAVARHPGWDLGIIDEGGHHAHVHHPERWLEQVTPWLERVCARDV